MDNQKIGLHSAATGAGHISERSQSHNTANPASTLLSRLDKVRNSGRDQWLACCPAHKDRTPSLSVRELPDGRVLIHCFGGCSAAEVLASVDLGMADLFPDNGDHYRPVPRSQRWDYRGLLKSLCHESTIVMYCASDVYRGRALTAEDYARLRKASNRITRITEVAHE